MAPGGLLDRGLAYGEACFETMRVWHGDIFGWDAHMQRLRRGLESFGLSLGEMDIRHIRHACLAEAESVGDDVLLRVTLSGGEATWGLLQRAERMRVHLQATAFHAPGPASLRLQPWPFPLKEKPAKYCADYAETLRALRGEPDAEVLFAREDVLLGAATASVLLYMDGAWHTPAGPGVLPGIVRAYLIERGLLNPGSLSVRHLRRAEAVLLSNSGFFLRPVTGLCLSGGEMLAFDSPHPAYEPLAAALRGQPGVPGAVLL